MRELERKANPNNHFIGRQIVVEIMDRGESLEKMLGVKLKDFFHLADHSRTESVVLRLAKKNAEKK